MPSKTYLRAIPIGCLRQSNDIKGVAIFLALNASARVMSPLITRVGTHHGMPDAPAKHT